jgi:AraC-like DNA-binding protein
MESPDISLNIRFKLLNAAKCQLDSNWNYSNITSPFSRLYLVINGHGCLTINNQKIDLFPGFLYLIPSYVTCSYYCEDYLEKYYLHFTNSFTNGLNIFDISPISVSTPSQQNDYELFDRLLSLYPNIGLNASDPEVYHKKNWVNESPGQNSMSNYLESIGIIYTLFSRFFSSGEKNKEKIKYAFGNMKKVLTYIDQNISGKLPIKELADLDCLSADHFTRSFKKIIGHTPNRYINLKRIEKAELLLITTDLSIKEIAEKTGFNSVSFFNRVFKKITGSSPMAYKRIHLNIL